LQILDIEQPLFLPARHETSILIVVTGPIDSIPLVMVILLVMVVIMVLVMGEVVVALVVERVVRSWHGRRHALVEVHHVVGGQVRRDPGATGQGERWRHLGPEHRGHQRVVEHGPHAVGAKLRVVAHHHRQCDTLIDQLKQTERALTSAKDATWLPNLRTHL